MTQPPLLDSVPPDRRVVRCEACHRPLDNPTSRRRGKGPHCADEEPLTPRGWVVGQDTLPGLG